MRQTNYLHNGAHFDGAQHRDNMADRHGLLTIPDDDPVEGHGATALPLLDELQAAELILEMAQIPLVTQESQEGESFYYRLRMPIID
jgi:hypothetical protein